MYNVSLMLKKQINTQNTIYQGFCDQRLFKLCILTAKIFSQLYTRLQPLINRRPNRLVVLKTFKRISHSLICFASVLYCVFVVSNYKMDFHPRSQLVPLNLLMKNASSYSSRRSSSNASIHQCQCAFHKHYLSIILWEYIQKHSHIIFHSDT